MPHKYKRMVLDPKSTSHNDYGSIHEFAPHALLSPKSSSLQHPEPVDEQQPAGGGGPPPAGTTELPQTSSTMTQRQPLLPITNVWGRAVPGKSSSDDYSDTDSDDVAGVNEKHHIPNGHVKIDMPPPMREEPRFPKEKWKTFIAFIILVFSFLVCTAALSLVHDRVPDRDTYGPLPDIVLDFIPAQDKALDVSEVLIMISVLTTFVFILVHKHRFIVFRRVFLMLSLLYLMRSLTMYVTVMPIASRTYFCSPKSNTTSAYEITMRVLRLVSGFGLSINGKHTYCGDYIYSGHTVILVLSYLIIAEYSPKKLFPLHWAMLLSAVVGIIMVLIAHGHYTVDVLIAYYVTTRLFWVYHTLCNNPQLKQYTTNNFLGKTWWFPVFLYFEKNVGGVVPRQYEWPLSWPFSWPRRFTAKHPNRDS